MKSIIRFDMKKRFCAGLFVAWALVAGATQYVVNPDFEEVRADGVAPGWERAGDVFSIRKGEGFNGTRGLVYENADPKRYRFPFQPLGLKPGKRYLVTAKIRTENIQGKDIGAGVCVEFTAGGAYSKGFKGTTDGWVKIAFTSDIPVKATADSIVVAPFVRRGCTGKAWFDEICVTDLERPMVETITSSAYRDIAESGTVAFVVTLNLENADGWKGEFSVASASGMRKLEAEKFTAECAAVRTPVSELPMGESTVSFHLLNPQGGVAAEKSLVFKRIPVGSDRRRVRIDSKRRTLVDGKPFFPLGISIDPRDASCIDVIAKSPFNCVSASEAQEEIGFYDICQAKGLMLIGDVGGYFADIGRSGKFSSSAEAEKALRERVEAVRNHPALLAWQSGDEFPAHLAGVLSERRALLAKLDPNHPTYNCTCHPEDARRMLGAYDVAGSDPYPIGVKVAEGTARAARWARLMQTELFGLRAVWQVPQVFDWIAHRAKAPGMRAPTYDEMRSMVWQAIAEGANGIICYAYMSLKWAEKHGHDPFEKRWAEICKMAAEVKAHSEELLSDEPAPRIGELPEGLSARGWTKDGVRTVVLVNQRDMPLKGSLLVDGERISFNLKPLAVEFRNVNAPTFSGIRYGSHEREAMDVWLPKVEKGSRVPLVVEIHGGGWRSGTRFGYRQMLVAPCIRARVALASISYRLISDANGMGVKPPVKACVDDAISAVRFLKGKADGWGLDTDRIMLTGSSAGACSSLIAAFRDDCALGIRQLYVRNPQTSLDPKEMREWIPNVTYGAHAFGCADFDEWLTKRDELMPEIERYSPVTLVDRCTPAKAPSIIFVCNPVPRGGSLPKDPTHAGMFCVKLAERCKARGIRCDRVWAQREPLSFHIGEVSWDQLGLDEALVRLTAR